MDKDILVINDETNNEEEDILNGDFNMIMKIFLNWIVLIFFSLVFIMVNVVVN